VVFFKEALDNTLVAVTVMMGVPGKRLVVSTDEKDAAEDEALDVIEVDVGTMAVADARSTIVAALEVRVNLPLELDTVFLVKEPVCLAAYAGGALPDAYSEFGSETVAWVTPEKLTTTFAVKAEELLLATNAVAAEAWGIASVATGRLAAAAKPAAAIQL
jgi:hypothetical protein